MKRNIATPQSPIRFNGDYDRLVYIKEVDGGRWKLTPKSGMGLIVYNAINKS